MGKFKNKIQRFLYGRYGGDTLNNVLLGVYLFIVLAYFIGSLFIPPAMVKTKLTLSLLYYVITITLFILIFYRMLSRNIAKRRRENERFCGFFRLRKNKIRDRKTHVYRTCPNCRAVLRLPRAKGKHNVVCPRCKHRFEVKG